MSRVGVSKLTGTVLSQSKQYFLDVLVKEFAINYYK